MDNGKCLPSIRKIDCPECMDKGVVWSDEGVLRWFADVERMENKVVKGVYTGECAGSLLLGK